MYYLWQEKQKRVWKMLLLLYLPVGWTFLGFAVANNETYMFRTMIQQNKNISHQQMLQA